MEELFLSLINISIKASWLVLIVLFIRYTFKNMPKWVLCMMWGLVGLRLIMPFSIQSVFSMLPSSKTIHLPIDENFTMVETGITNIDIKINQYMNANQNITPDHFSSILSLFTIIWFIGVMMMCLYTIFTYYRVYKKVKPSIRCTGNVYLCDDIDTPFILGVIKPKIYVPSYLSKNLLSSVLQHEYMHIQRKDHYYKPIGFLLLSIYWFNPVMWFAYILLCNDIEAACDEAVIKSMNNQEKKLYLEALFECSVDRYIVKACPIAFGEVDVKTRTKNIIKYKKPAFIITFISCVLCLLIGISFLTDPKMNRITDINDPAPTTNLFRNVDKIIYKNNNYVRYIDNDYTKEIIDKINKIEISKSAISLDRSDDRDSFYRLGLRYSNSNGTINITYINISEDCSALWIEDGVKPTLSYKVYNQEF